MIMMEEQTLFKNNDDDDEFTDSYHHDYHHRDHHEHHIMSIILLTRKVNLIMSLGILAGLLIHITVIWLIDMVIIIVIINRPWPAGPGWIVGMIHF